VVQNLSSAVAWGTSLGHVPPGSSQSSRRSWFTSYLGRFLIANIPRNAIPTMRLKKLVMFNAAVANAQPFLGTESVGVRESESSTCSVISTCRVHARWLVRNETRTASREANRQAQEARSQEGQLTGDGRISSMYPTENPNAVTERVVSSLSKLLDCSSRALRRRSRSSVNTPYAWSCSFGVPVSTSSTTPSQVVRECFEAMVVRAVHADKPRRLTRKTAGPLPADEVGLAKQMREVHCAVRAITAGRRATEQRFVPLRS